jgi:hypothetical protein
MKKIKLLTGLAVVSTLTFIATGCKKDNNNGGSGGPGISATINGTAWQSQLAQGFLGDSFIELAGLYVKSGDSSIIAISVSDTAHIGQADPYLGSSILYETKHGWYTVSDLAGGHGTITVSSWDKNAHTIAGTFNGVFYNVENDQDSIKVENGHFNSSYEVQ